MALQDILLELFQTRNASDDALLSILTMPESVDDTPLLELADRVRRENNGDIVHLRCLVEISNYCKNNCYYCGIRRGNTRLTRYRLTLEEIYQCCAIGYAHGIRTFVLQGGEDVAFTDDVLCDMIARLREHFSDATITLSLGERSYSSYLKLYEAGARRYLLRHETADYVHYGRLHPQEMSPKNRQECLYNLKEIGYETGAGMMVGSPYQTPENLLEDLRFLQKLQPEMVGIGPFLPQHDTPFSIFPQGELHLTLRVLALTRLILPTAYLPATTALGSLCENGRELALQSGANVLMPNFTPQGVKEYYALYDGKRELNIS